MEEKLIDKLELTIYYFYNLIMYVILKYVKINKNIILPVIMLDTQDEVWEFDNEDQAQKIVNILNINTDLGHKYEVKKV